MVERSLSVRETYCKYLSTSGLSGLFPINQSQYNAIVSSRLFESSSQEFAKQKIIRLWCVVRMSEMGICVAERFIVSLDDKANLFIAKKYKVQSVNKMCQLHIKRAYSRLSVPFPVARDLAR
jgi:hypothetical protein